jgi:hypothetical protein
MKSKEDLVVINFKQIEDVDSSSTDYSYWFAVCETEDINIYLTVKQKHLYFDFDEAKDSLKNDAHNKKIFISDFYKISKETYDNNN